MRKNISSLLQKGNLTPKQRYLLIIQNDAAKARTGKEILTEADIKGLEGWHAQTNEEAREWNKYNEGWKLSGRAGIDAEFIYAETKAEHFRKNIMATELAIYPFYRERLNALQALKKIKVVDINEAIAITKKQREQKLKDGLDFDYAIYELAFESLSDEIRKDILILDQEAEYEPSYLEDEETIADLLNGKEELTKEAKEKYAELVADRSYNKYAKEYQLRGAFASLPIMDLAKKWAKDKGIKPRPKDYERLEKTEGRLLKEVGLNADEKTKDKIYAEIKKKEGIQSFMDEEFKEYWALEKYLKEILADYARDNKTTIEAILKKACLKWLDEGLLDDYTPLVLSESKNTYSGDTKHPHKEIFKEWLKTKAEAKATLQKLIDKGELKAEQTGQDKTITGESLYDFKGDFKFIKEFKERVDRYETTLGDPELLIAKKDKDGKPAIVSIFGMSLRKIESVRLHYFKEVEKNSETYLEFKDEDIEKAFKDTRQSLIDGYAKLLAFSEIFKKLDKIYKTDLTSFIITPKIKQVSEFIDLHNEFLDTALENITGFGVGFGLKYEKPLKTKEDLFINKDRIAPDFNTTEEYGKKFYEILGDEYKF